MTGRDREARRLRTLVGRIGRDWEVAEEVHARLVTAVNRVGTEGADTVTVGAAALYLQNLYSAIEELLRRIAIELDGAVLAGPDWHRELIEQLATEVDGIRPRVLDEQLTSALDLVRRFRHVVRHAYARPYDWDEMRDALSAAERVMKQLPAALSFLKQFLDKAIAALEQDRA